MSEITVVATFTVKEEDEEAAIAILKGVVEASHGEEGCLLYSLHKANNKPQTYTIVEKWRSQADLDNHFGQPHMKPMTEAVGMLAEPPTILFCEPVPVGDSGKGAL
jgi:quinol monooxygenase YgiN